MSAAPYERARAIMAELGRLETDNAELKLANRRLRSTLSGVRESRDRWKKLALDAEWQLGIRGPRKSA